MYPGQPIDHASRGFTLAELLIALMILGVIATFTIPKILTSQQDSKRLAIFKEVFAAADGVIYQNYMQGRIQLGGTTNASYLLSGLNAVKVCSSNAQSEGCWTQALDGNLSSEAGEPGLLLHNGATIIGLSDALMASPHGYAGLGIDWNGADGPNTEGQDQLRAHMCWETTPCWGGEVPGGTLGVRTSDTASRTLYTTIFQ